MRWAHLGSSDALFAELSASQPQARLDEAAVRSDRFRDHPVALQNNIDLLVLTRPEIISGIHHAYLEAEPSLTRTREPYERFERLNASIDRNAAAPPL